MDDFTTITNPLNRDVAAMFVFPIIKVLFFDNGTEEQKVVGTGFFVDDRRFLSAKHVFLGRGAALDSEGATRFAVYCAHAVNLERKLVARPIDLDSLRTRADTDIISGLVEARQFFVPDPSISDDELLHTGYLHRVSADPLPVGTAVYTVACPLVKSRFTSPGHLAIDARSDAYEGKVTAHYPEGRDRVMLPWPVYETSMPMLGGASGGPVFVVGSSGTVFAVNCAGFESLPVSHVTSVAPLVREGRWHLPVD